MKTQIVIILIILSVGLTQAQEKSIKISSNLPSLDVKDHKQYDVEVYVKIRDSTTVKYSKTEQTYGIAYFANDGDSLKCYTPAFGTYEVFDIAFYKWVNDSSVAIKLHNSINSKNVYLIVFGKGSIGVLPDATEKLWKSSKNIPIPQ